MFTKPCVYLLPGGEEIEIKYGKFGSKVIQAAVDAGQNIDLSKELPDVACVVIDIIERRNLPKHIDVSGLFCWLVSYQLAAKLDVQLDDFMRIPVPAGVNYSLIMKFGMMLRNSALIEWMVVDVATRPQGRRVDELLAALQSNTAGVKFIAQFGADRMHWLENELAVAAAIHRCSVAETIRAELLSCCVRSFADAGVAQRFHGLIDLSRVSARSLLLMSTAPGLTKKVKAGLYQQFRLCCA